jgi:hypothetical protein
MPDVDLDALAHQFGLAEAVSTLERVGSLSVRLGYADGERRSRLGGTPDLPSSVPWPLQDDRHPHPGDPLLFVGQLDLADLAELDFWPGPRAGLASFFCAGGWRSFSSACRFTGSLAMPILCRATCLRPRRTWTLGVAA